MGQWLKQFHEIVQNLKKFVNLLFQSPLCDYLHIKRKFIKLLQGALKIQLKYEKNMNEDKTSWMYFKF